MTTYTFAQLPKWVLKVRKRMDAVVQDATQTVVGIAQTPKGKGGRLPVDTGFLRGSLQSTLNGSTTLDGGESYILTAGDMVAGDFATFGWHADYARRINSGFTGPDSMGRTYNQQGAHFVEGATDQWQAIVRESVVKARAALP